MLITRLLKVPIVSWCRRCSVKSIIDGTIADKSEVTVNGWVRSVREHKLHQFVDVYDGSCRSHVQVVIPTDCRMSPSGPSYGCSVKVTGTVKESGGSKQSVDVIADSVEVIGECQPVEYPFKYRKEHPPDYARQYLHLRPRAQWFSSLLRIRNQATQAIHQYFQDEGFIQVHTPVLTSNDCEGAGEVFQVEPADKRILEQMEEEEGTGIKHHFFNTPAYLSVSGQLQLEAMLGGFSKVYSFGPTFRAENSRGRHHLSEFYMVEGEVAFTDDLTDITQVMENLIKKSTSHVLDKMEDDVNWFLESSQAYPQSHKDLMQKMLLKPFVRMTYHDAINVLEKRNDTFQFRVKFGCDLHKEHERYLVQHCDNVPVFVTDFPAAIKPFYMKANDDDNATVAAVDLLAAGVGELCGGSLREDRLDVLQQRIQQYGVTHDMDWYLDLRRFGSVPHGGFGLGFERYLQLLLGIANIKDTIPFPRWPSNCKL